MNREYFRLRAGAILVAAALLAAGGFGMSAAAVPRSAPPRPDSPTVDSVSACTITDTRVEARPSTVALCETSTVTMTTRLVCPSRPVHVVFSVKDDYSTSNFRGAFIQSVRNAVEAFDRLSMSNMKVALVASSCTRGVWQGSARTLVPLTDHIGEVEGAVAGLVRVTNNRCCADPRLVRAAQQLLVNARGSSDPVNVIVYVSDSFDWNVQPNDPCPTNGGDTVSAARSAKSSGTQIIASCHSDLAWWNQGTIKYPDCPQTNFNATASSLRLYVASGTRSASYRTFASMARTVTSVARGVTVDAVGITDTLSAQFETVPGSLFPPGEYEPATRALSWMAAITDTPMVTASYRVRPTAAGVWPVSAGPRLAITDSLGKLASFTLPPAVITVTGPCDTPTPPPSPTATASPTPTHTPLEDTPTSGPTATRTATPAPRALFLPLTLVERCDPQHKRADVALVIDTSSSMAGRKLEDAKSAAAAFVGQMDLGPGRDQVAVVRYDTEAEVACELTNARASIEAAIRQLASRSGTHIDKGLRTALTELQSPRRLERNMSVMILLTDGVHTGTPGEELRAAAEVRAAGVRLYTIGLGADADAATLREMAGADARYHFAPDSADLARIYGEIASDILCPAPAGGFWPGR